ncbi:disease resistance protein RPM1-like [Malania oleifera]|uniref:disease resistance protein RPM1-like n=1 Tax=Malania oleifera TaxID=397392 RepID=UPI0025AEC61F|nr:disease resistance protein RPM1-like [Malania oleifera]
MAETAVNFVIDRLAEALLQEATLLRGIRKEVGSIKDELRSIQSFLKDADARSEKEETNESMKAWLTQLREVAYHIEDVIDEYTLHNARQTCGHGPMGILYESFIGWIVRLKPYHEMANEIKHIKENIQGIKSRGETFIFNPYIIQGGSSNRGARSVRRHDSRLTSPFIEEDEVVGIDSIRKEIIGLLVEGESTRSTISVVGMGGIGKSTLARKVYDANSVTGHFHYRAWIAVSQSYNMEELLRTILQQLYRARKENPPEGIDRMEGTLLITELSDYLRPKRYLIVLDDVWAIDFWRYFQNVLPKNDKGSRVLVTTRYAEVARFCKESSFGHLRELQSLPEDKAWELFCMKAFQSRGACPPELEALSIDIVGRCEGLPLAIVAIGGLLSTKDKTLFEWQKLHRSLGRQLITNPHLKIIPRILSLSYQDLPYNLKSCLLYCGIFPEDHPISCNKLIRLWIAEGFVHADKGITLEEIAEEYLMELIHRNLVQVSEVSLEGKARSCRLHDLMHEFIISKSKELSFYQVLAGDDLTLDEKSRHLSILSITDAVLQSISNYRIRSVLLFVVDKLPKSFTDACFANFKLLKVLDFENAPFDYLPENIGDLLHLTYLSMKNTNIKLLPKSTSKLHKLETLNLKGTPTYKLPRGITRLRKLRHLLAYFLDYEVDYGLNSLRGVNIREGIGSLKDLQKLCFMEANQGVALIEELVRLKQLRRLGLTKLSSAHCRALCASIQQMRQLESLSLQSKSEAEILDLQAIPSPPLTLKRVYLKGPLKKLPNWIPKLQNLVKLRLSWSRLRDDPNLLVVLQDLPKLLEFELHDAYDEEQLKFGEGSFQKLKVLRLQQLNALQKVIIDEGAMPLLEELTIGPTPELKEVPSGIQHLKNLTNLTFFDMPEELALGLQPGQGRDYYNIQHIPTVLFTYKENNRYTTYTLR